MLGDGRWEMGRCGAAEHRTLNIERRTSNGGAAEPQTTGLRDNETTDHETTGLRDNGVKRTSNAER
jgi:hypothetical protein